VAACHVVAVAAARASPVHIEAETARVAAVQVAAPFRAQSFDPCLDLYGYRFDSKIPG
jgi:hypothetical protein